ncbi:hypothetical protein GcC1_085015 [Golovinomyces cichoracearum]|uniref:CFEM domain-containing protein n=1 Tax=Golovinomyces cichoracearum TaxID=62708 RepID=A0A420IIE1_9PEZI|nr:hypothetical protein GcC1_085015 [Golovinomyces cichoracearum]
MKNLLLSVMFLAIQSPWHTIATFGWYDSPAFFSPSNFNNKCTTQQEKGFDWSDLETGPFSDYRELSFSGFSFSSEFTFGSTGINSVSVEQSFQEKCITSLASSNSSTSPGFGLGLSKEISAFSITKLFVSVEFDCDLEFQYTMVDGSACKQRAACSRHGSVIENTQCGGATSVIVLYPSQTSVTVKDQVSCHFGLHSIAFDCNAAPSTKYIPSIEHTPTTTKTELIAPTSVYTRIPAPIVTSPPIKSAPYPIILPACMNTWISTFGCSSNADVSCFCPLSGFSTALYSCIAAHAKSESEIREAQAYFQGICVNYISINPVIVIDTLPLVPVYSTTTTTLFTQATTTVTMPTSTVAYTEVVVELEKFSISTTITVPEVVFTTVITKNEYGFNTDIGLVPATASKIDTKIQPTGTFSQAPIPMNPIASDCSQTLVAFCVLGAAFLFAAAIVF